MADKDVRLVIRARNEASKALDSVTNALKTLDTAQGEVSKGAKETDNTLGQLAQEFRNLTAQVKGLDALSKVAGEIDRMSQAVGRLQDETRSSAQGFANYARDTQKAQESTARLRAEAERLERAYDAQKRAVAEARRETLKSSEAAKELTRAQRALDRAMSTRQTGRAANSAKVLFAGELEKARAAVEANARSHNRLQGELDQTGRELKDVTARAKAAASEERRLEAETAKLASRTREGAAELAQSRSQLQQMRTAASGAAEGLGNVTLQQGRIEASSKEATAALKQTEATLRAMERYSTGGTGFTDPKAAEALRRQRTEMERVRQTWQTLEAEVKRQAVAMRGLVQPTQQQTQAFNQTVAAARAAKTEFRQLQAALARLQGSSQSSFQTFSRGSVVMRQYAQAARAARSVPPPAVGPWRAFFNSIYGDSRKAMSMMQRLRGEVLSLSTAYFGLYGVIQQVGGVITAYQKLEAAQNRLGVVFGQNDSLVRRELQWLERQAARLGIEFGVLSDQYAKFSIAARQANFTSEATRDVFLSVAESGRVAKLSLEQMQGIFLALEQMISKGKVTSEELRRQLGDRLPGAFNIMAKALGVSTAELDSLMKKGEVFADEETLTAFANELTNTFGAQLPEALQSTTTLIGKFANSLYQARLRVGRGGFIEGLNEALRNLDEYFQSREGRDFFLSLGAALGNLMTILAQVPHYFGLISTALKGLVAIKVGAFFLDIYRTVGQSGTAAQRAAVQFASFAQVGQRLNTTVTRMRRTFSGFAATSMAFATSLRTGASGMSIAAARAGTLRIALTTLNGAMRLTTGLARTMWAAIGGLPGAIITGLTFVATELIGAWVGGVDDATQKIDEHDRVLQTVLSTYEDIGKATADWAKQIEGVTREQAESNFIDQVELYEEALDDLDKKVNDFGNRGLLGHLLLSDEENQIRDLVDAFDPTDIDGFIDSILELNDEITSIDAKKLLLELLEMADNAAAAEQRTGEAAVAAKELGSELDPLETWIERTGLTLEGLTEATEDSGDGFNDAAGDAVSYKEALQDLHDLIPSLSAEMERLQKLSKLDTAAMAAGMAALREGLSIGPILDAYGQGIAEINAEAMQPITQIMQGAEGTLGKASALLREFEGFEAEPYWDVNAYRTGFGSDTITLADGTIRKVTEGMRVSVADANRDLERRIGEFQTVIRGQIGNDRWEQFSSDQQAALTSIAYNYGSLPDRILGAVRSGSNAQMAAAVRSLTGDNDGVNADRRRKEAFILGGGTVDVEGQVEAEQGRLETIREQEEATQDRIDATNVELEQSRLVTLGRERELAVQKAINAALEENPNISNSDLTTLAERAGQIWDEENVTRVRKEQAEATGERIEGMEQELSTQELISRGLERQAAIEEAMREAREENPHITEEELARVRDLAGRTFDLANATSAQEAAEERVNNLLEHRKTLQDTLKMQLERGDTAGAAQTRQALEQVNSQLLQAIDNAIKMWRAIGGEEADLAIAKLENTRLSITGLSDDMTFLGLNAEQVKGLMQSFASGLTGVFDKFAQAIANGEDGIQALGQAFLEFAANFLIEMGKMIIQQAILNALQGFMGGFGGGMGGVGVPMGHTGGIVGSTAIGSGNGFRTLLSNASYYHDGGIVGLRPQEMVSVLEQGEEVLTRDDPRHILNGGGRGEGGQAAPPSIKIVNSFDSNDVVSEALNSSVGEQTLVNVVKRNASTLRSALGIGR